MIAALLVVAALAAAAGIYLMHGGSATQAKKLRPNVVKAVCTTGVTPLSGALFSVSKQCQSLTNSANRRYARARRARAASPQRGDAMPTVIGHHDVKDTAHWLGSPKRAEFFGPLGITNIRTFVDPQNSNHVAVMMDVPDMDALMGAMQTQGAADAMANDGVLPETLVILIEA